MPVAGDEVAPASAYPEGAPRQLGWLQVALVLVVCAGALLALICWAANYLWLDAWSDMRFFQKLAILLATIAFAGAAFFGTAFFLRISEVQDIIDVFRRKVGRL